MAKVKLYPALVSMRGALDGFVYKHYANDKRGMVLSRVPDMSRVKPSKAQLAHRQRMRAAAKFHQEVLNNPVLLKKYQRIAKHARINLSAATMGEVLRRQT
jgi:hypothetical protein